MKGFIKPISIILLLMILLAAQSQNDLAFGESDEIMREGNYEEVSNIKTFAEINHLNISSSDSLSQLFYKGHNYQYYSKRYKRAKRVGKTGRILTMAGIAGGSLGTGMVLCARELEGGDNYFAQGVLYLGGGVLLGGGTSLTITGIILQGASVSVMNSSKKAMSKCSQQEVSLKLGASKDGLGLVLKF